jgi:hypothetical protein
MSSSSTSAFSQPKDFVAALLDCGMRELSLTSSIAFRAQVTSIKLDRLHLLAATERAPRVAVVSVPATNILIVFSKGAGRQIWGGFEMGPGQLLAVPGACRTSWQTTGPIGWGAIRVPAGVLASYGKAIAGKQWRLPAGELTLWDPPRGVLSSLVRLHDAAIRRTLLQPEAPLEPETGHGLEQRLLAELIECLVR